jgi:hypothetical protein
MALFDVTALKIFKDFLSAIQINHGLNMCVSFSKFFIAGRHIFRSKSPVYICSESRCLNISNTLKQNTVRAEYYLAGNDRVGVLGRASSKGSSLHVNGKGKVHPCTGTEALYRPYGPLGE